MKNIKVKTTRPSTSIGVMGGTTSGVEPDFSKIFVRRKGIISLMHAVKCDVCGKDGWRLAAKIAPEGWLYGETYMDSEHEVCVTYVCGLECCAMFWQPGPGDLAGGKQVQSRRDAVHKKTEQPHYARSMVCPKCGSTDVIDASQSLDCNSCGHSW